MSALKSVWKKVFNFAGCCQSDFCTLQNSKLYSFWLSRDGYAHGYGNIGEHTETPLMCGD